jgi:3-hydroxyisobutyrate dehydrogenase-like beta-hydroxyacid dehydrogenase
MSTPVEPSNVSVIGLGLMGSALAESLLKAGHNVTVWNRSAAKVEPLVASGARPAASVAEAIADSDLTIVCLANHAVTSEVLSSTSPFAGHTLVQLSTMTPDESRKLAAWAEARGIAYLDGSILGVPTTVRAGAATIICSGPRELFDANEPVLRALGTPLHLSPEIGAAVTFDRIWYAYAFATSMAFMQGAAMAHALGFSKDVYFETVRARTPVTIDQLMALGEKIAARSYATSDARLDVWADAFLETLSLCRETGVNDTLPAAMMSNFERARAAGYGDKDLAALFETLIPIRASDAG